MVYVVTDGSGFVKIGVAKNVNTRIKELQTGNPRTITLVKTIELPDCDDYLIEHALHDKYQDSMVFTGGTKSEWFYADGVNELLSANKRETQRLIYECGAHGEIVVRNHSLKYCTPLSVLWDKNYLGTRTYQKIDEFGIRTVEELEEVVAENSQYIGFGIPGVGEQRQEYILDALKSYHESANNQCKTYDFRTSQLCKCIGFECKKKGAK